MATLTKKAIDLAVGDYLVHIPASVDNSEVTKSAPYPQVTGISYGGFSDGQLGVNYALDGGHIDFNMLASLNITVANTSVDDGKTIVNLPADRLSVGNLLNSSTITDVKIVATTSDSVQHQYALTDVVQVTQ